MRGRGVLLTTLSRLSQSAYATPRILLGASATCSYTLIQTSREEICHTHRSFRKSYPGSNSNRCSCSAAHLQNGRRDPIRRLTLRLLSRVHIYPNRLVLLIRVAGKALVFCHHSNNSNFSHNTTDIQHLTTHHITHQSITKPCYLHSNSSNSTIGWLAIQDSPVITIWAALSTTHSDYYLPTTET